MAACNYFIAAQNLVAFSELLSGAIHEFNQIFSSGTIVDVNHNYHVPVRNLRDVKDITEKWEGKGRNICCGRYLLFENTHQKKIKFWIGLDFTSGKIDLLFWFEKSQVKNYLNGLKSLSGWYKVSTGEVWIKMPCSGAIEKFKEETFYRQNKDNLKEAIKKFMADVFEKLN